MKNVSDEQEILKALQQGRNVFITGSAGSGKTYLATEYGQNSLKTAITATTGISSLTVKGETIHRFLGLGTMSRPEHAEKITSKWFSIKNSKKSWDKEKWKLINSIDTIIIDEISMLRRDQFELMDVVLSNIKDTSIAFGGIQMVLVGDFFQLPPVVSKSDLNRYKDLYKPYAFQSQLWNNSGFKSFNLTSNYRQNDENFINILENIRVGNVTKEIEDILNSRVNVKLAVPLDPVKLFSRKLDVANENIQCLKKLPGVKYASDAEFEGTDYDCDILSRESPAEKELFFGVGAQVMMLNNDSSNRWVNGTMGIIRGTNPVRVQLSDGKTVMVELYKWERTNIRVNPLNEKIEVKVVATMKQYPFKLAYATTIHKSQGLTLDYVDIDLSDCFTSGQAYVALSRCKQLSGLSLRGFNKRSIIVDDAVKRFYEI